MFGNTFYNQTTRRYVALFGTLFNDISIQRFDNAGVLKQTMKVPLNYGPMQKFLSRLEQDPDLTAPAITLPRMSFELISMDYDGERKLTNYARNTKGIANNDNSVSTQFTPTPYNLEFQLNIMAKYDEDATKIVEQILPFFKPEFTVTAKLIDSMDMLTDIPIVLNSISSEDSYEGSYEERRAIIWTLTFTVKGYYYGPVTTRKVIKFANTNIYSSMTANNAAERVMVQPGLTANGAPTTDIAQTVPYANINIDDDWAYIVRIETLND
jgi:hypothetical protein